MVNEKFTKFIEDNKLFTNNDKILIGLSGGSDSVFLTHLLVKNGYNCAVAHMNFKLRDKDAEADEKFSEEIAKTFKLNFFSKSVDTIEFASKNKLSVEMAARELRYRWFNEILEENKFDYIAVGHNQDDNIETYFINIIRGTGIAGMTGIKPKNKNIVRPILCFSKEEILNYLHENKIFFRTDLSNFEEVYVRNRVRHILIPEMEKINNGLRKTIIENIRINNDIQIIYNQNIEKAYGNCVKSDGEYIKIDIEKLKNLNPVRTYLFEFLKLYNFNSESVDNILANLDGESGKQFFSETHRLLKDRKFLIVTTVDKTLNSNTSLVNNSSAKIEIADYKVEFSEFEKDESFKFSSDENVAYFDFDKIKYPLKIRNWHNSDKFMPLGMKYFKKVSDFLIDNKVDVFEKQKVLVLEQDDNIIWLIGHRIDNRFKITEQTNKILKAVLKKIKE